MNRKELQSNPIISIGTYICIILFVVLSTKAYVWYLAIQQAIDSNIMYKKQLEERIAYLRDFRLPYLSGDNAKYFIAHENDMPHPNEQVIKFVKKNEVVPVGWVQVVPSDLKLPDMSGGRAGYLKYKLEKIMN